MSYCTVRKKRWFCVSRKGEKGGGSWHRLQGDMHMVTVCRNALVGTGWSNSCLVCTNRLRNHCSLLVGYVVISGSNGFLALNGCLLATCRWHAHASFPGPSPLHHLGSNLQVKLTFLAYDVHVTCYLESNNICACAVHESHQPVNVLCIVNDSLVVTVTVVCLHSRDDIRASKLWRLHSLILQFWISTSLTYNIVAALKPGTRS